MIWAILIVHQYSRSSRIFRWLRAFLLLVKWFLNLLKYIGVLWYRTYRGWYFGGSSIVLDMYLTVSEPDRSCTTVLCSLVETGLSYLLESDHVAAKSSGLEMSRNVGKESRLATIYRCDRLVLLSGFSRSSRICLKCVPVCWLSVSSRSELSLDLYVWIWLTVARVVAAAETPSF